MISSLLIEANNSSGMAERNNPSSPSTAAAAGAANDGDFAHHGPGNSSFRTGSSSNSSRRFYHHSSDSSSASSSQSASPVHWERQPQDGDRRQPNQKSPTPIGNYCSSPELQQQQQHLMMAAALRHPLHPAAALQMQTLQHNLRHLHHGLHQGFHVHHSFGSSSSRIPSDAPGLKTDGGGDSAEESSAAGEKHQQSKSPDSIRSAKSPKPPATTESNASPISATPHGIEHILSRPLPARSSTNIIGTVVSPQFTSASSTSPHLSPTFPHQSPASASLNFAGLPPTSLAGVYWPTLPGFMGNPALQAWRDRLNSGKTIFKTCLDGILK